MHEDLTKTISDMQKITEEAIGKVKKAIGAEAFVELLSELIIRSESGSPEHSPQYLTPPSKFQGSLQQAGLYGKGAQVLTGDQCEDLKYLNMVLQEQGQEFIAHISVPRDTHKRETLINELKQAVTMIGLLIDDLSAQQDGFADHNRLVQPISGAVPHAMMSISAAGVALDELENLAARIHDIHDRLQPPTPPWSRIEEESAQAISKRPTASRTVFIVHGHDESNKLKLDRLLRERWHLEPIVLLAEPGKGRTLIEKFEQEAERAAYAIVLFTPDDLVEVEGTTYTQARPNAIFELGWFYGRLGRERVCILFRKGTKIPSDLDGITRIEFDKSVEEKIGDIEKELAEAGLLREINLSHG